MVCLPQDKQISKRKLKGEQLNPIPCFIAHEVLCLSVSIYIYIYIFIYISLSFSLFPSLPPPSLSLSLSLSLPVSLSRRLSLCLSTSLSIHKSIFLSISPIYVLSVCLSFLFFFFVHFFLPSFRVPPIVPWSQISCCHISMIPEVFVAMHFHVLSFNEYQSKEQHWSLVYTVSEISSQ